MSAFKRILNAIFTTLPATGFGILEYISHDIDYFWRIYDITIAVFLVASLFLGFFIPVFLRKILTTNPWLNVIIPALLAYIIAGLALAVISITPLCIGQENGDGTNNLSQCIAVSGVVSVRIAHAYFQHILRCCHHLRNTPPVHQTQLPHHRSCPAHHHHLMRCLHPAHRHHFCCHELSR